VLDRSTQAGLLTIVVCVACATVRLLRLNRL
jgi:hypothetical protein